MARRFFSDRDVNTFSTINKSLMADDNEELSFSWEDSIFCTLSLTFFKALPIWLDKSLIESALVVETFWVNSVTNPDTKVAWFSRPVVTFPSASLLTAELLVRASEISTKFPRNF